MKAPKKAKSKPQSKPQSSGKPTRSTANLPPEPKLKVPPATTWQEEYQRINREQYLPEPVRRQMKSKPIKF